MLCVIFCVKAVLVYRGHCSFVELVLPGLHGCGVEEMVLCARRGLTFQGYKIHKLHLREGVKTQII